MIDQGYWEAMKKDEEKRAVSEKTIEVKRSDMIFMTRALDVALAEIEAAVGDGDVKEEVLLDLEHAYKIMEEYLGN